MSDNNIAEQVAERLEGKKLFTVSSRETLFYHRDVYAFDADEAENICMEDGKWGDASDSSDFETLSVTEKVGVK
jgi:hypothetical protein